VRLSSHHEAILEQHPEATFITLFTIKATRRDEILTGRIKSLIAEAMLGSVLCAYSRDAMSRMYQVNPELSDWVGICTHSPLKESAHLSPPRKKNKTLIALLAAQKTSDDDLEDRVPLPDLGDLEPYVLGVDLNEDFPAFWR